MVVGMSKQRVPQATIRAMYGRYVMWCSGPQTCSYVREFVQKAVWINGRRFPDHRKVGAVKFIRY